MSAEIIVHVVAAVPRFFTALVLCLSNWPTRGVQSHCELPRWLRPIACQLIQFVSGARA
jgi:hypothetical protein